MSEILLLDRLASTATQEEKMLQAFLEYGSASFVRNASVSMRALLIDREVLPVVFNDVSGKGAYSTSLYAQYIAYGKELLGRLVGDPKVRWIMLLLKLGDLFKAANIDKTLQIDNWLLYSNLHHEACAKKVAEIKEFLAANFPYYAFMWRSVSPYLNPVLFQALRQCGFQPLFHRTAYVFNGRESKRLRHLRCDIENLHSSSVEMLRDAEWSEEDFQRMAELHDCLQVQKYSSYNPQLTAAFIKQASQSSFLKLCVLKNRGKIDAVYGSWILKGVMATPLFGYDTSQPLERGLYRQINALSMLEALEKKLLYHMGGGAASFKKRRGGIEIQEYHMIYASHLPAWRRSVWQCFLKLINRFSPNLSKKIT